MIIRLNLIAAALLGAATALAAIAADAQVSGDVVRIGVINDMSGLYSDLGGEGSVAAAKLAVEDFGPTVLRQEDRDRLRLSSEQAGRRVRDRAALDRRERRRCHRRRRQFGDRARYSRPYPGEKAHLPDLRAGQLRSYRQAVFALRLPFHLRHLCGSLRRS